MPFDPSYSTDIDVIILSINNNLLHGNDGAIQKFTNYLQSIQQIGPFNSRDWQIDWRKKIWKFGEIFQKN